MRNYLRQLKSLDEYNFLRTENTFQEVPEEVFRLLRVKFGIAFIISGNAYFWKIGNRARLVLLDLESFSGKYVVGKDAIGYWWKIRRLPVL